MYTKILVAVDGSSVAESLYHQAVDMALMAQAELMLLHVLSAEESGAPSMPAYTMDPYQSASSAMLVDYQKQWETYRDTCLQWLKTYSEQASERGVKAEFSQLVGSPGRAICDAAKDWGADLIMVGRRGRSGLVELLLGSVSNYVLHRAHCSVLVVQSLPPDDHG